MLTDTELNKYADVLFWGLETARKKRFKKNDIILIQYEHPAVKLAEILFEKILERGLNPIQRMGVTYSMERSFYKISNKKQLQFIPPGEKELFSNLHGRFFLRAPESLSHLRDINPAKIGKALVVRKQLRDILDSREERGLYGWTLCMLPTRELIERAHSTPARYTAQVVKACYLDRDNPVKEWKSIYIQIQEIKKWLNSLKIEHLFIESKNLDLKINFGEKRRWAGISGHNIPSFEIFFSPDWRGTEGKYYANLPSFRSGNYVEKIQLIFKKGSVINIEAKTGAHFAHTQLTMDKGASKIGEFSLTDKRFSRIDRFMADTLFDENFGGTYGNCHIALGSSYTTSYDGNPAHLTKDKKRELGFNDSALHWDLVNTENKRVVAQLSTGKKITIYDNGKFTF